MTKELAEIKKEVEKIYLVGTSWYSGDQGDMPNTSEFPSQFFTEFEEAEKLYEELKKDDKAWGFGCQTAYVVSIDKNGNRELLKGSLIS